MAADDVSPYVVGAAGDWDPRDALELTAVDSPLRRESLGDLGRAVRVSGPDEFPLTILVLPLADDALAGLDTSSVRLFRSAEDGTGAEPVEYSGHGVGRVWARITRPGTYVPVGLPLDPLLRQTLHAL